VRAHLAFCVIKLRCDTCNSEFEVPQGTIAGIVFGRHLCHRCGVHYEVDPDAFLKALGCSFPDLDLSEMFELTAEATRIARSWYSSPHFRELLSYQGVDLGPPTERHLLPHISQGVSQAWKQRGGRT
jgi:hypothetical protein